LSRTTWNETDAISKNEIKTNRKQMNKMHPNPTSAKDESERESSKKKVKSFVECKTATKSERKDTV
jgi:hypothetical protein